MRSQRVLTLEMLLISSFCSWEYPGTTGIGCNTYSVNDTSNFLLLLKELRASPLIPKNLTLSAAVSLKPFTGDDGQPLADVSEFAKVLNYIGKRF